MQNKQTTVNVLLFQDVSKVFGSKEPAASNPHLTEVDSDSRVNLWIVFLAMFG